MNFTKRQVRFSVFLLILTFLASCSQIQDSPGDSSQLETLATLPSQVRLYLASGATNNYLATNAGGRETLKQSCPLQFNSNASSGALLTLSATGSSAKVCHTSTNQLVGVYSSGESSTRKFAVNAGETLSIALGSDTTLKGFYATSATLSVNQTSVATSFDVKFYDGTKLIGTKRFSPTGTGTTPKIFTLAVSGKPFTKVTLVPVQGSFSLKGGRNVVAFTLTGVREYRYKFEYEHTQEGSYSGSTYSACAPEPVLVTVSESEKRREYRWATHVYRGQIVAAGVLQLNYLYTAAGGIQITHRIDWTNTSGRYDGVTTWLFDVSHAENGSPMPASIPGAWINTFHQFDCGVDQGLSTTSTPNNFSPEPGEGFLEIPLSKLSGVLSEQSGDCTGRYEQCVWRETRKYSVTPK